jgi:cbb3-type cytochrome oxidase maturation protein
MSISYALVLLALGILGCAIWALFWAIDDGQYDELEQHASAALEDDDTTDIPSFLAKGDAPP